MDFGFALQGVTSEERKKSRDAACQFLAGKSIMRFPGQPAIEGNATVFDSVSPRDCVTI